MYALVDAKTRDKGCSSVDVKTYYAFNLEIYPGTKIAGLYLYSNKHHLML